MSAINTCFAITYSSVCGYKWFVWGNFVQKSAYINFCWKVNHNDLLFWFEGFLSVPVDLVSVERNVNFTSVRITMEMAKGSDYHSKGENIHIYSWISSHCIQSRHWKCDSTWFDIFGKRFLCNLTFFASRTVQFLSVRYDLPVNWFCDAMLSSLCYTFTFQCGIRTRMHACICVCGFSVIKSPIFHFVSQLVIKGLYVSQHLLFGASF